MYEYELQKQVNGDEWARGKKFYAENDDEAERIAAEWINFQRLYYGEGKVRIIKTVFIGNLRQLSHPIEDDDKYKKIREVQLANEAEMYLRVHKRQD